MDEPMADVGVTLLDRLDFLRGFLLECRGYCEMEPSAPGDALDMAEIDAHLATVDDACEALKS